MKADLKTNTSAASKKTAERVIERVEGTHVEGGAVVKAAKKSHVAAVPAVAAPTPRADDGAELLASTKRGIMHTGYHEASLADLLVQACGVVFNDFSESTVGIADEIGVLQQAICEGNTAEDVSLEMVLHRLERRVRVIAEVQRRIDAARTVSK